MATGPPFIGSLSAFDPSQESISAYIERVEVFFAANDVKEEKRVAVFLSVVGAPTFSLLRNLLAPEKPTDKTLRDLTAALITYYEPKPLVIAQRFHFHRRDQQPSETIAEYVAALRKLSIFCEFGAQLDDALRDRLVCGIRSEAIQKHLLSVPDLTFKTALEKAQGMEAADRNSKDLHAPGSVPVHHVRKPVSTSSHRRHPIRPQGSSSTSCPPNPERKVANTKHCHCCGKDNHHSHQCRFLTAICRACGKQGHIAKVCHSKPKAPAKTHALVVQEEPDPSPDTELHLFTLGSRTNNASSPPITVTLQVNEQPISMEVDTGAEVSVMSEQVFFQVFPHATLQPSSLQLKTYTDDSIPIMGETMVQVHYGHQSAQLPLIVVAGIRQSLMGRNWLQHIKLDWKRIAQVSNFKPSNPEALIRHHHQLFDSGLGTYSGGKVKIQVQPGSTPRFHKPRPVPFAIKEAVGMELDRLEAQGIIEKVTASDWAAPIVAVPKRDGSYRICGDYKVTTNPVLEVDQYPLPRPSDLFASLAGGKSFSTLDLTQAYQQLLLDDSSKKYTTINTHKGLYQYTRLPFGIASAPAIFQKTMDTILQGLPHVCCYLDDILVTGPNDQQHLATLESVFTRLETHGLRLKGDKCSFLKSSVEYLGHRIDAQGIHTLPSKLEAIQKAPQPENVTQLRSFLGLLNYYGKFIVNLSTLIHPLNDLLKVKTPWNWSPECATAFQEAKQAISSATVLAHYDPTLPIVLAGDASAYGIGAVISHVYPDGSEHPIAFASRTLTKSESNYAQLEKEALSLNFGIKRFHQYLYGRPFTLLTDHKPLLKILGPKTGIPSLAAARMQRWALLLSAYSYNIKFRSTQDHSNADSLSRLPLKEETLEEISEPSIFNISQLESLPVTNKQVQAATVKDPILSTVWRYTKDSWPASVPDNLLPYYRRKEELTVEGNCLLWGIRVVIPQELRQNVLQELHRNHPGVVKMKSLARSYLWWPGLDQEIEALVKGCPSCQQDKPSPPVAPLQPWIWPSKPWDRIHVDFAGPFQDKMFFVAVDAHSKWPEVYEVSNTTAEGTVRILRHIFASHGIPHQLVSDNGPQFVAQVFTDFLKQNGVKHIRCSPYHPSSNGLAERFIRTFKAAMKAGKSDRVPLSQRLANFLLGYRSTPHSTTNRTPSQLFLNRELRTRLDLLKPNVSRDVAKGQASQKFHHDKSAKAREFQVGQAVWVRDVLKKQWIKGKIAERIAPYSYKVQTEDGKLWRRHVDRTVRLLQMIVSLQLHHHLRMLLYHTQTSRNR